MKKLSILCLIVWFSLVLNGQDTFSIVALDPETGEVGAAGATCIDGSGSIGGVKIINTLIPGRGGVNAQAWICINPHINLDNAIQQMGLGKSPQEIIDWLQQNDQCSSQNFDPQFRQYGIVDFDEARKPRTAAFTGSRADDHKGHLLGATYAIQGNILLGPEVLKGLEKGFTSTEGSLAEKLMAAMQEAKIPGADTRCLGRGTTSTTAFLRVAKPDDSPNALYLDLDIPEVPFGQEPIDALQVLFDQRFPTEVAEPHIIQDRLRIAPNPGKDQIRITLDVGKIISIKLFNNLGQLLSFEKQAETQQLKLNIYHLQAGIFWLLAEDQEGRLFLSSFVKH